ncbi:UDP-Glycosyltransferase/glycogen phosphorylase [Coccomyxa subellipsoidea C-169]|uniref:Glycosyltransferase n=1 Tax=Coccomyxa subellipsoidea (strain C-169) TaxID=574566 RepID=I0Z2N9_COCSC|nr:UDP-Glycosyltransferase/glycogen phosphorylase [Coccomyxa subellipsoidea C-169]EIE24908.1 UDP-Glycosyltransferase/glycogen phosphorylase [Coccomyxa subellipsoidea C-169]|eukprot:XP_005649452.1 UDP-Glycosyltransferase/glycogen phosphorylase [Coccomyxa subellipsoidea C-169]
MNQKSLFVALLALSCALSGPLSAMLVAPGDVPKMTARDKGEEIAHMTFNTHTADLEGVAAIPVRNHEEMMDKVLTIWHAQCHALLSDADIMARLQGDKPDLILGVPFFPCTTMLAAKLGVPYISLNPSGLVGNSFMHPLWAGSGRDFHIGPRLSSVPEMFLEASYPLTFLQRMQNAWLYAKAQLHEYGTHRPMTKALQAKHGTDLASPEARRLEMLHIVNSHMAYEQPRPLPPNVKLVGPIMAKPAAPLPPDLQEFVEGAGDAGVALISLGTLAKFDKAETQMIASALSRLPIRTIWKMSKQEVAAVGGLDALNLTDNVKVVTWVPQNDVLGHPSTKAFLSHCGANGLNEAAYHGVPVVAMPFYGDQPMNARKLIGKGMAVALQKRGLSAEGVYDAFTRVLTDESIRAAAAKVSKRIRSRKRSSVQETADWVEHVLDSDGEAYMQLPDDDMSFFVRNSLDVAATFFGLGVVALIAGGLISAWVIGGAYRKLKGLAGWEKKMV